MRKIKARKKERTRLEKTLLTADLGRFFKWLGSFWLIRQLWPEFEELPVGLMAYSSLLIICFDGVFQNEVLNIYRKDPKLGLLIFPFLAAIFIFMSIYHVFSDVPKDKQDKKMLVGFAAFCCLLTGIWGGMRLYTDFYRITWIRWFAVYNILQGLFLALLIKLDLINENCMKDHETPFWGAITNFIAVTTLFLLFKFVFELYWVDYFSILVAFAMTFASPLCDLLYYRPKLAAKQE